MPMRAAAAVSPPSTRRIGLWMTVALVMGNMIGSGIFLVPSSLAPYGALGLAGWLISTVGALLLAIVFAHLARLRPAAGGPYAYARVAFGDLAGFLVAWGYWISMWTGLGALAVAFVGYFGAVVPALSRTPASAALTAIAALWLLIGVNAAGVRSAAWVQLVTTVLKTVPLAAIGTVGLVKFDPSHFVVTQSDPRAMIVAMAAAATLTLWAFQGLESATVPAESIDDPDRTIPRATVLGTLLTAVVYITSTVGVMSLIVPSALGQSQAPFADAARTVWGDAGATIVALGASISVFGALNGWVLLVGQLPMAVAEDGLFPRIFARRSRNGTPTMAMVIAGVLTTVMVALNYTRGLVDLFTFFILLATVTTLIPYASSAMAVFLFDDSRGSRVSAGIGIAAAGAFAYSLWAIAGAGQEAVHWGFLLLMVGLPVYVVLNRRRPPAGLSAGARAKVGTSAEAGASAKAGGSGLG